MWHRSAASGSEELLVPDAVRAGIGVIAILRFTIKNGFGAYLAFIGPSHVLAG
jgi:hypothetical protein